MTISVYKDQDVSQKPVTAALPKVNVRPATAPVSAARAFSVQEERPETSAALMASKADFSSLLKTRRKDWDVRFAVGLIAVVVLVNITLTLLLGGESESTPEEQTTIRMEPSASQTAEAPASGDRSTEVYISSEEKRLLLRHLYAPDMRDPHPRNNEQGTYRSLSRSEDRALSIIGAGPSAGE